AQVARAVGGAVLRVEGFAPVGGYACVLRKEVEVVLPWAARRSGLVVAGVVSPLEFLIGRGPAVLGGDRHQDVGIVQEKHSSNVDEQYGRGRRWHVPIRLVETPDGIETSRLLSSTCPCKDRRNRSWTASPRCVTRARRAPDGSQRRSRGRR